MKISLIRHAKVNMNWPRICNSIEFDFDGLCKAFPKFQIDEIERIYMQVRKMGNGENAEQDMKCCGSDAR